MKATLRCTDLRLRFSTGFEAGPLDLDLGPGIHHLRGENGTGKTTLLRCLCGHYQPTSGTVRVGGRDPLSEPDARRRIALMPAEAELPDFLTVDEAWQQIAALRGAADFDGARHRDALALPGGLLLAHASAGQRRMAEFLCAIAGAPDVLLLDEVFANLDPRRVACIVGLLDAWRHEHVILVTSHLALPLSVDTVCVVGALDAQGGSV